MHKKFDIIWTKIKGGCQSGRKIVTHNSKSDLLEVSMYVVLTNIIMFEDLWFKLSLLITYLLTY